MKTSDKLRNVAKQVREGATVDVDENKVNRLAASLAKKIQILIVRGKREAKLTKHEKELFEESDLFGSIEEQIDEWVGR